MCLKLSWVLLWASALQSKPINFDYPLKRPRLGKNEVLIVPSAQWWSLPAGPGQSILENIVGTRKSKFVTEIIWSKARCRVEGSTYSQNVKICISAFVFWSQTTLVKIKGECDNAAQISWTALNSCAYFPTVQCALLGLMDAHYSLAGR